MTEAEIVARLKEEVNRIIDYWANGKAFYVLTDPAAAFGPADPKDYAKGDWLKHRLVLTLTGNCFGPVDGKYENVTVAATDLQVAVPEESRNCYRE